MKNLNLRVEDEVYWRFRELKAKLKAETNEVALLKMIELTEKMLEGAKNEGS